MAKKKIEGLDPQAGEALIKVNFGVYISHMRKAYSVEEIEESEEIQEYLISIGSPAVTKL